jgi:polyferredoxin
MPAARPYIPLTPVAPDGTPLAPAGTGPGQPRPRTPKKAYTRRAPGHEQLIRQSVQLGFLILNAWIGAVFYLWVRYYETGGQTLYVSRPPGVEGWLPIASLMNLKALVLTGEMPATHPAGMFLIAAFMGISLLVRKAFCSWLCPIGTISEWLWQGGQALFGRTIRVWRWLDIPLRSLKYVLLALFLYAVGSMPPDAIRAFLESPYGVIADVKMLNFFRALSTTAAVTIGVLLLLSVVVKNAWCRYLCPYGALTGLLALVSPARIRRDAGACIDCAKCAKACPSGLPVDRVASVRSAECSACLMCVTACPAAGALDLALPRRRVIPAWAVAVAVLGIFLAVTGAARASGYWHTHTPDAVLFELVPRANQFGHPGR